MSRNITLPVPEPRSESELPKSQPRLLKVVFGLSLALLGLVGLSLDAPDASAQASVVSVSKVLTEGSAVPAEPFSFSVVPSGDACTAVDPLTLAGGETANFEVTFANPDGGGCSYTVSEVDLPPGCSLVSENGLLIDRNVMAVTFTNECVSLVQTQDVVINKVMTDGSLVPDEPFPFTITPSGETCSVIDPLTIAGGASAEIQVITVDGAGDFCNYTVTEGDLPAGCSLVSENDLIINVDFATLTFTNECLPLTQTADVVITKVMADGSDVPDEPFPFTITPSGDTCSVIDPLTIAGGASAEIQVITVDEAGDFCNYTVTEGDLPAGCSLVSENDLIINVDITTLTFTNTCDLSAPIPVLTASKVAVPGDAACDAAVADPLPVTAGDVVKYCITVTNAGVGPALNVTIVDDSGTPADTADDTTFTYTDNAGALAEGASWTVEYTVTIEAGNENLTNSAEVTAENETGDPVAPVEDTAVTVGGPVPALTASKVAVPGDAACDAAVADPLPVTAGDVVKYCITVTNAGVGPALNVTIVDDSGTPADTADDTTFTYTDNAGALAEGASWTVEYTVTIEAGNESIVNSAQVTGENEFGDPTTPVEDTATTVETPTAGLAASKVAVLDGTSCAAAGAGALVVEAGDVVKYCITVTNNGPASAYNVVIADDSGTPGVAADDLTFTFADNGGELASGASWTVEYTVTVVAGNEQVTNSAQVTAENEFGDPVPPTSDTAVTTVAATPVVPTYEYPTITNMPDGPTTPYGFEEIQDPGPGPFVVAASAPASAPAAADSQLAHTGSSTNVYVFFGTALLGFGALAVAGSRRMNEDDS